MDLPVQFDALEPNGIIVFGLLLLFGVLAGIVANRFPWMPTITALMIIGVVLGPFGLNVLTKQMLADSSVLIDIALGLILYKLGNMLHPLQIIRSRRLTFTSLAEAGLTFLAVMGIMTFFGYSPTISALVGAIAVSSSPAILVHVAEEMKAAGPVTERAKSLVAMNNLFSFLIFTAVVPFTLTTPETGYSQAFVLSFYRLIAALVIGISVAWAAVRIAKLLRIDGEHYRFAVTIGAITLTLGLSKMLFASILFSTLILGIATKWFEKRDYKLSHIGLGEGGDLFYIILFVMAGAKTDLHAVLTAGFLPILLALARTVCKFAGVFAIRQMAHYTWRDTKATGLLLIPMAGMALGLVATVETLVPEADAQLSAIVFAMVAIFETVGPFAAAKAFRMSGEAGKLDETKEVEDFDEPEKSKQ